MLEFIVSQQQGIFVYKHRDGHDGKESWRKRIYKQNNETLSDFFMTTINGILSDFFMTIINGILSEFFMTIIISYIMQHLVDIYTFSSKKSINL